jgi:hypothetical protein
VQSSGRLRSCAAKAIMAALPVIFYRFWDRKHAIHNRCLLWRSCSCGFRKLECSPTSHEAKDFPVGISSQCLTGGSLINLQKAAKLMNSQCIYHPSPPKNIIDMHVGRSPNSTATTTIFFHGQLVAKLCKRDISNPSPFSPPKRPDAHIQKQTLALLIYD